MKTIITSESDQSETGNVEGTSTNIEQSDMTQNTTTKDIPIIEAFDSLLLDTPPETVETLRVYEKKPGKAQKFLGKTKIFFIHFIIIIILLLN